jgi:hypothetical protein
MSELTEPGQALVDNGCYFEFSHSMTTGRNAASTEITFGPALARDIGCTTGTLDLLLTRQFRPDQTKHGLVVS